MVLCAVTTGQTGGGGEMKLGLGRVAAYAAFEKNRELIKEIDDEIGRVTRVEGQTKVSAVLREYVEQLIKQASAGKVDSSAKEQVEGEIRAINDFLERMVTIR